MKLFPSFHRPLLALLPALLLASACSDDKSVTPTVEHGQVMFINAASHIAPATLKFQADASEKASLDYGKASSYQSLEVGNRAITVLAGSQTALNQTVSLVKDQHYTFVATPAATQSAVGGLFITDNLPTTTSTSARIRVINLAQAVSTPLRLSQKTTTVSGPVVADLQTNIMAATATAPATAFVEFPAGTYNLSILDSNGNNSVTLTDIGNGDGTGTGTNGTNTKNYEAGKIYTVVVTGTYQNLNQAQGLKAFLYQNN